MKGYYKKRYAIAIYKKIMKDGDVDEFVDMFDTVQEFAVHLGKSVKQAYDILGLHYSKKQDSLVYQNKMCELAFIDMR